MKKDDVFFSERLFFRGIDESDTDCLVAWRSEPEIIQYFSNPTPLTKQSHIYWFNNNYLQDNERFDFIILEKASNRKIGFVGIKDIVWSEKTGEIMYTIAEKSCQKKGYATEAIAAILTYVKAQIFTVYAVIHTQNIASVHTITSAGFELDSCNNGTFLRYKKYVGDINDKNYHCRHPFMEY